MFKSLAPGFLIASPPLGDPNFDKTVVMLAVHNEDGALGFVVEVSHAIEVFEVSGWLALGAFGLGLVALTAWLERRARVVRAAPPTVKVSSPSSAALP